MKNVLLLKRVGGIIFFKNDNAIKKERKGRVKKMLHIKRMKRQVSTICDSRLDPSLEGKIQ